MGGGPDVPSFDGTKVVVPLSGGRGTFTEVGVLVLIPQRVRQSVNSCGGPYMHVKVGSKGESE